MKKVFCLLAFIMTVSASASDADFQALCKVTLQSNLNGNKVCEGINNRLFKEKGKTIVSIDPTQIGAPRFDIDSKIEFLVFNDPNFFSGFAYCYFVYRNWITPTQMGPDQLAMSASGFAVLNEDVKDYQVWLKTKDAGLKCKARVEKESEVTVADLEKRLVGKIALIGLNPYASIQTPNVTEEMVMKDMALTLNHERIHAYQVACPEFEKWSIGEWQKLPVKSKNEFIKKYPNYTWSIPKIAGREYIGFLYEGTPESALSRIGNCKIK